MSYAPVVMFTYNRPEHTSRTISSLLRNTLAKETEVTIYSDAPKSELDVETVAEVREYLRSVSGFRSLNIIEQTENQGLANSIISGVTRSVNQHGRTVVLEDDMLTSPHFLTYMNQALDFYQEEQKVMHVAGWGYPISEEGLDNSFLWRGMNCWGWATWADRWRYFEKDTAKLIRQVPLYKRRHFDLKGRRKYWSEVENNRSGKVDTWAVFWYATIYLRGGLCANPTVSLVRNIGLDGTGMHCISGVEHLAGELSQQSSFRFQSEIEENPLAFKRILEFYDKHRGPLTRRIYNRCKGEFDKWPNPLYRPFIRRRKR